MKLFYYILISVIFISCNSSLEEKRAIIESKDIFPFKSPPKDKGLLIWFNQLNEFQDLFEHFNLSYIDSLKRHFHFYVCPLTDSNIVEKRFYKVHNNEIHKRKGEINQLALKQFTNLSSNSIFLHIKTDGTYTAWDMDGKGIDSLNKELKHSYLKNLFEQENIKILNLDSIEHSFWVRIGIQSWPKFDKNDLSIANQILIKALQSGETPFRKNAHPFKLYENSFVQILPFRNEKKEELFLFNFLGRNTKNMSHLNLDDLIIFEDGGMENWRIEINPSKGSWKGIQINGV